MTHSKTPPPPSGGEVAAPQGGGGGMVNGGKSSEGTTGIPAPIGFDPDALIASMEAKIARARATRRTP